MVTQAILALPWATVLGLVAALIFSGVVKGVLGVGLPLILVPLTTQFLDVPVAVALLTVPMIATNIGQALEGGRTIPAIWRLRSMLAALVLGTLIGVHLLISVDRRWLAAFVGVSFILLAAMLLALPRVRVSPRADRWAAPLVGLIAALLGGVSAIFGPPMIAYLVGRGTDPATFVKYMAILALTASSCLLLALGMSRTMAPSDLLISAAAMIPIQLGMPIGRLLRGYVKLTVFRTAVLLVLAFGGLDMLRQAFS
jgi:uncharacterized protein